MPKIKISKCQHFEMSKKLKIILLKIQYAIQLEFMGQHEQSIRYYQQAIIPIKEHDYEINEEQDEHNWVCKSGYF